MGVLRLLYCDSAGVRRCRAVPYNGDLPTSTEEGISNAHASAAQTIAAAVESELSTTPSLLEAAAAGIISLRSRAPPSHFTPPPPPLLLQQQDLAAGVGAITLQDAGPFAQKAAALAAAGDTSFSAASRSSSNTQSACGTASNGPRHSNSCLLPQASSTRLLQPLTQGQMDALKVAVPYSTGLTKGTMGQPASADTVLPESGLSSVGEVLIVPDLGAVAELPWTKGHCMAPVDMMERDLSRPFGCCPRSALKHALAALEIAQNITLMVGFELEFYLLRPLLPVDATDTAQGSGLLLTNGYSHYVPFDTSIYSQSTSFDQAAPVLDKMVEALQSMGIGVVQYHAESGPGQFEIATTHFPALEAVDKLLLTKEAISAIARQQGLEVTFLPKPFATYAGSGCHCHISLWEAPDTSSKGISSQPKSLMTASSTAAAATTSSSSSSVNTASQGVAAAAAAQPLHSVPGYPTLSATAAAFVAGLLEHLPALLPFTAPSNSSYKRLQLGTWSGASACWGWDNREAPLRLCCPNATNPACCNIEYKPFDGTTNPYIGLVAIVAAGLRGLQDGTVLPPPVQVDPSTLLATAKPAVPKAAAAAAADTLHQLPGSLTDALTALQQDSSLQVKMQQLLGAELLKAYLAVKAFEAAQGTPAEQLLLRY